MVVGGSICVGEPKVFHLHFSREVHLLSRGQIEIEDDKPYSPLLDVNITRVVANKFLMRVFMKPYYNKCFRFLFRSIENRHRKLIKQIFLYVRH